MARTIIEPFKIKMIEPLQMRTVPEREAILKKAGNNLFLVASSDITFDFLTDSGTTAMSAAQWGAMMVADESYAGSKSFHKFEKVVKSLTGYPHVMPTHQGRAAEHLLFSFLVKKGLKIPSNNHFDSTRSNIEELGGTAVDLAIEEGKNLASTHPFKGNVDLEKLEAFCKENRDSIPFGMMTITNNNCGGQPVSMANLKAASEIYRKYSIPFLLDACRFAENSYFIKIREKEFATTSVREIARKTFELADGCLMSAKKDGLVNIGGLIALKGDKWLEDLRACMIFREGFPTYGGLAARDLEALAVGLEEVLDESYLDYRLAVSRYMGEGLNKLGIPTVQPIGGHAVFIDAKNFLSHIPVSEFPAQTLVRELYSREGIRAAVVGDQLVRLAFPRRVYTQSHFDYVLEGFAELVACKSELRGLRLTYAPQRLPHFTARYEAMN